MKNRPLRRLTFFLGTLLLAGLAALLFVTRSQAHNILTNPQANRRLPEQTPGDWALPFEAITVTAADGLRLAGWYIPTQNGAVIMAQHGYKGNRAEMLNEAAMFHAHGYGVLLTSVRAHDYSEGEQVTFGYREMQDLEAWYQFLLTRPEVDPERLGILGNSMGGSLVIQYAAQNPQIKALAANCAFSSLEDTVNVSIKSITGLPPFPFAPLILWWGEQESGLSASDINAKVWISTLSPRPVFLMQGGADNVVSSDSGQRLYDAAGEPKTLWFEPALGHTEFDVSMADEYEKRVVGFFDEHLRP